MTDNRRSRTTDSDGLKPPVAIRPQPVMQVPRPTPFVPDRHLIERTTREDREAQTRKESPPQGTPGPAQEAVPPPSSLSPDAKVERAAGVILVALARKLGWGGALGLIGIVFGGGTALKQLGVPGNVDKAIAEERKVQAERELEWRKLLREWAQYHECRRRNVNETLDALTPDLDKMGSATRLKPWVDRCKELPSPEPPK